MKYSRCVFFVLIVFASMQITAQQKNEFTIRSSGVKPDGSLSIEFTGEGEGVSMPLEWTNIPEGCKYFALNLWHLPHAIDPSDVKSYWVVYNIPSDIKSIPKDAKEFGSVGYNDKDRNGYDPMKSKGPGVKEYNLTIYALSEKLEFSSNKVYRSDLLKAIKGKVLGESTLKYTYETGRMNNYTLQLRDSGDRPQEGIESLTQAQKEKIKAILSNYDAATLTANNAKALMNRIKEANIPGGKGVEKEINNAGFDFEKIKKLAPPPARPDEKLRK